MSTAGVLNSLAGEMTAIVGREYVCEDPQRLLACAVDGVVPRMLVLPGNAEEIAAVLRLASDKDFVVVPVGGATRIAVGAIPDKVDIALSTARLNAVEGYDPGDLTISLGAGVRVAEAQRLVAANRQMLPLDVARDEEATIGGVLASGDFGPLKHSFGGAREFCIGVKFVTGDGRTGKGGGRVVKNVAGYDMMKLMIGSHGSLAVITSANFKLFPVPRRTVTFHAEFASLCEAIAFRKRISDSPLNPLALELITPRAHEYLGLGAGERWGILLQAGGSDAVLNRYRNELGVAVKGENGDDDEAQLWSAISNFEERVSARHANVMTVEMHLAQSELSAGLAMAERSALEENFLLAAVGRCAVASMVLAFVPIAVDPPPAMQYVSAISALRAGLPRDGAAIVTRCPLEVKRHVSVWGTPTNGIEAMQAIKQALDPKHVLNRGRFLV